MRLLCCILLFITFSFIGCTKSSLCDTGKVAGNLISAQIATQFDCKNLDAVRADVEKSLVELKICDAKADTGVKSLTATAVKIGDVICKPVTDALAAGLLTQIPATWQCSGGKPGEELKAKLLEACSKAF